jgi:hypothetical protein
MSLRSDDETSGYVLARSSIDAFEVEGKLRWEGNPSGGPQLRDDGDWNE